MTKPKWNRWVGIFLVTALIACRVSYSGEKEELLETLDKAKAKFQFLADHKLLGGKHTYESYIGLTDSQKKVRSQLASVDRGLKDRLFQIKREEPGKSKELVDSLKEGEEPQGEKVVQTVKKSKTMPYQEKYFEKVGLATFEWAHENLSSPNCEKECKKRVKEALLQVEAMIHSIRKNPGKQAKKIDKKSRNDSYDDAIDSILATIKQVARYKESIETPVHPESSVQTESPIWKEGNNPAREGRPDSVRVNNRVHRSGITSVKETFRTKFRKRKPIASDQFKAPLSVDVDNVDVELTQDCIETMDHLKNNLDQRKPCSSGKK